MEANSAKRCEFASIFILIAVGTARAVEDASPYEFGLAHRIHVVGVGVLDDPAGSTRHHANLRRIRYPFAALQSLAPIWNAASRSRGNCVSRISFLCASSKLAMLNLL